MIKYYYLRHQRSITIEKKEDLKRNIDLYNVIIERYKYIQNIYPNFLENEIALVKHIIQLYLTKNKKIKDYLKEHNALELYKKTFSIKMIKSDIKKNDKIKILLFRINPKLCKLINNVYLKFKNIKGQNYEKI